MFCAVLVCSISYPRNLAKNVLLFKFKSPTSVENKSRHGLLKAKVARSHPVHIAFHTYLVKN